MVPFDFAIHSERSSNPILKVKSEQGIQIPHSGGSTNLNKQIRGKTHGMRCLYTNAIILIRIINAAEKI